MYEQREVRWATCRVGSFCAQFLRKLIVLRYIVYFSLEGGPKFAFHAPAISKIAPYSNPITATFAPRSGALPVHLSDTEGRRQCQKSQSFCVQLTEWSLTNGIRHCTEFVLYKNTFFSIEPQVFLESLEIQPQNILRISLLNTSFKPICLVLMRFCVKLEK